ncbi:MAG: AAC(3) family N-acetyltransferase [Candidatus Sumerlaeaceae bacterium]
MFFAPVYRTQDLAEEFERIGLRQGDSVVLHSSLKSIGNTADGAATVVDALLQVTGRSGNIRVPTYTYNLVIWNTEPYDHYSTRSRVGVITEEARSRARAQRSFHPSHSVTVIGPEAAAITSNHLHSTPIGRGSPLDRMRQRGAKILMLGTCQDTNSSLHLAEVLAGLPYVAVAFQDEMDYETGWFYNENRQVEYVPLHEFPGCSRGFRKIEYPLRERGVLHDVRVGNAASQLLDMRSLCHAAEEILQRDPTLLLCEVQNCAICPRRRAYMNKVMV